MEAGALANANLNLQASGILCYCMRAVGLFCVCCNVLGNFSS